MSNNNMKEALYLPIRQIYFDQIIAGTKKEEIRELKPTTYKKYLPTDKDGWPDLVRPEYETDESLLDELDAYNNGIFIYKPIPYKYLDLAVGYNKNRDTARVEVVDITFEPMGDEEGNEIRYDIDENDQIIETPDGKYTVWLVIYHLGKVVELKRG